MQDAATCVSIETVGELNFVWFCWDYVTFKPQVYLLFRNVKKKTLNFVQKHQ